MLILRSSKHFGALMDNERMSHCTVMSASAKVPNKSSWGSFMGLMQSQMVLSILRIISSMFSGVMGMFAMLVFRLGEGFDFAFAFDLAALDAAKSANRGVADEDAIALVSVLSLLL